MVIVPVTEAGLIKIGPLNDCQSLHSCFRDQRMNKGRGLEMNGLLYAKMQEE